jgi:hypothetical protein
MVPNIPSSRIRYTTFPARATWYDLIKTRQKPAISRDYLVSGGSQVNENTRAFTLDKRIVAFKAFKDMKNILPRSWNQTPKTGFCGSFSQRVEYVQIILFTTNRHMNRFSPN